MRYYTTLYHNTLQRILYYYAFVPMQIASRTPTGAGPRIRILVWCYESGPLLSIIVLYMLLSCSHCRAIPCIMVLLRSAQARAYDDRP